MHQFEVRILNSDHKPSLILPGPHASVTSALHMARKLAARGHAVEVWRDNERVHHEVPDKG